MNGSAEITQKSVGLGESFTDEDLDNLQPAEEVAAEIKDHLIPRSESKPETKTDPVLTRR